MDSNVVLAGAGLLAGAMNALAGGGSFLTFPALVFAGVPSVMANASSTVALYPGSAASAWALRCELRPIEGVTLGVMVVASVLGGLFGAVLLLLTPQAAFDRAIPWLLLLGTLAFAFGRSTGAALRRVATIGPRTLLAGQFLLAIYGGYFGGAVGLMMMAVWSLFGARELRAMNAAKTLLVGATNTTAVACFVLAGGVRWQETVVMGLTATVGGYLGARLAGRIAVSWLRVGITGINLTVTTVFFWRVMASP